MTGQLDAPLAYELSSERPVEASGGIVLRHPDEERMVAGPIKPLDDSLEQALPEATPLVGAKQVDGVQLSRVLRGAAPSGPARRKPDDSGCFFVVGGERILPMRRGTTLLSNEDDLL